jgi:ABC-type sugar transport system permease subunit
MTPVAEKNILRPRSSARSTAPFLLLAPTLALMALLLVYPLLSSISLSLHKIAPGTNQFVGLGNYRFLLGDRIFWAALANTTAFAAAFLAIEIPLAVALALLLNRPDVRARNILRFAFFAPHLVGYAFVGVLFNALLSPRQGGVDRLLSILFRRPIELDWLTNPPWASAALVLAALWLSIGLAMLYVLAALQSVRRDLVDAAAVDGARAPSRFFHVTLPAIRPVLLLLIAAGTIAAFQLFELPYVLFGQTSGPGGRGLTVVMYLFFAGFQAGDLGYASAIGWVLVVILALATLLEIRFSRLGSESKAPPAPADLPALPLRAIELRQPKPNVSVASPIEPATKPPAPAPRQFKTVLINLFLIAAAAVAILPLIWLICASLRRDNDPGLLLPAHLSALTTANYRDLLSHYPFATWMINSLFVSCTVTLLSVFVASAAGFALAKYHFPGRRALAALMLLTALVPQQVLLPSLYQVMHAIGWLDTFTALIVPGSLSVLGALLYRQAFFSVPDELLAAARADGAGEIRIWLSIAMPLMRPVTSVFVLLSFLTSWGALLWPQVVLRDPAKFTLPMGLANLASLGPASVPPGMLMAATVLAILPAVVLFFVVQREFIAGLTSGSLKE